MTQAILAVLDSRSFTAPWFWLLLLLAWTLAGRRVLGVPGDVVNAARTPETGTSDSPEAVLLLDWLSLSLPRWRLGMHEGVLGFAFAAFVLSALAVLGFGYGLEMAQALVLLVLPFALLFAAELRLARRVAPIVAAAEAAEMPVNQAATDAARLMARHRSLMALASVLVMALIAWHAAVWVVTHPFGY